MQCADEWLGLWDSSFNFMGVVGEIYGKVASRLVICWWEVEDDL